MANYIIKLYASDNIDEPDHVDANEGEFEFQVLALLATDEPVGDIERKSDGSLENNIPQRAILDVEFLPFYIKNSLVENQMDIHDLILLKKMLKQPYLVIKECTLPEWDSSPNNLTNEYPLPAVVRWNYEERQSNDKENGILEYSATLEYLFLKGQTQPTPTTTTNTYAY